MEIRLLMLQTLRVTIAILQSQIVLLVQIQANVKIIFFFKKKINKYILTFLIGLSCGNSKYLKNDFK